MGLLGSGQDKTEPATPRRLQEARRKGQVARSAELTGALLCLAAVLLCYWLKERALLTLAQNLHHSFASLNEDLTIAAATAALAFWGRVLLEMLAPFFLLALVLAVGVNLAQVGFVFSPSLVMFQLDRINVLRGLGRIFSSSGLVELGKAFFKLLLVGGVAGMVVWQELPRFFLLLEMPPLAGFSLMSGALLRLGLTVAMAYAVLGVLDFFYQRNRYRKELMMTKTEVKEEFRQTEGDPLMKGWIRRRLRQLSLNRIREVVPRATVVITNPVHLAVALKYEPPMNAPQLVAKGAGVLAQRIKELARASGVPVVENPPVAQFLYRRVEVGQEIPPALYQAVAEIIALVYRLRRREHGG
ncbi:EscU/YscU/HrcU family type III secretion system export apparatus switch protein [Desulfothermobacter acidiphilus]|uniref:EscU/YscU/HrcU family type III secretion system export apparatus switch protein n=1 Tax=Desulfothermobacter acidiphilus TaxID=1938353 RepID=UPI003F8AD7B7